MASGIASPSIQPITSDGPAPRGSASFHDAAARDLYAARFGAIGIASVAAGARMHAQRKLNAASRTAVNARPPILLIRPESD